MTDVGRCHEPPHYSPEFTAKYKAWLEKIGPELWGPVGKADYEKIIAEEAAAKQAEPKK